MEIKKIGPKGGAHPKFYYVDPPLNKNEDPLYNQIQPR